MTVGIFFYDACIQINAFKSMLDAITTFEGC